MTTFKFHDFSRKTPAVGWISAPFPAVVSVPRVVPVALLRCSTRGWPRCVFSFRSSQRHVAGIVENCRTCRVGRQLRCHACTLVLFGRDIVSVVVGGYQLSAGWIGISLCLCVSGVRSRASRRQRPSCSSSDLDRSVASPIRPRVGAEFRLRL